MYFWFFSFDTADSGIENQQILDLSVPGGDQVQCPWRWPGPTLPLEIPWELYQVAKDQVLSTSRDRQFVTSLGHLSQCFTDLVKNPCAEEHTYIYPSEYTVEISDFTVVKVL